MELQVDVDRVKSLEGCTTEIYVRAKNQYEKWDSIDIIFLGTESLLYWLRSRGGDNEWAETTACYLMGHSADEVKGAYRELGIVHNG